MTEQQPNLFGLKNSNRDFTNKKSWGKNQFNSSFPASLCCYLDSMDKQACYIKIESGIFSIGEIPISDVFGISPSDQNVFFAFET